MAGEKSVKSGEDGHKIVKEILRLIGWESPVENTNIECHFPKKHKKRTSKSDRNTHGLDFVYHYPNPLNTSLYDVAIISSKHNQKKYTSISHNLQNHLLDLSEDVECAKKSYDINEMIECEDKKKTYQGVLFWLASQEDSNYSIISNLDTEIKFKQNRFDSIYLIDNERATFLVSSVLTARNYRPNTEVKFLYPHTGKNMHSDDLIVTDTLLPISYINSSLLPIIIDDNNKISCLIFCRDNFSKDGLKRLIWFAHKICGLTNEIVLFFNDYDTTIHEKDVNSIKLLFKDNNLIKKLKVKKYQCYSFVNLKEEQNERETIITSFDTYKKEISKKIPDTDIDKILPFGEMLTPKLSSEILTKKRLRDYLVGKGIFVNTEDKQSTIPIFANLLLSPLELNYLKELYIEKENKPKEIERNAIWRNESLTLWKVINKLNLSIKEISPSNNSKVIEQPIFVKVDNNENVIRVDYLVEKTNTTKDLLTGTTRNNASIIIELNENVLNAKLEHTSSETYKSNTKFFAKLERSLVENQVIEEEGFEKITFGSFIDNSERIAFFMSFVHTEEFNILSNSNLENIKIKPDVTVSNLPEELESMKGNVRNLDINGKSLDELAYINEEDYQKSLLFERIKVKYNYRVSDASGACTIEYSFPKALGATIGVNSEFQTSIWINDSNNKKASFKNIIAKINKELSVRKKEVYDTLKIERKEVIEE